MPVLAGTLQLGVKMTNQRATLRSLAVLVVILYGDSYDPHAKARQSAPILIPDTFV